MARAGTLPRMEPPAIIQPVRTADYLEVLSKAVFESGMSWAIVEAKWPGFREAFSGFEPATIASYSPDDLDRLMADTRIIRNRRKVEATVHNARAMVEIEQKYGGMKPYLASLGEFGDTVMALKKRFKHVGDFGAYYFLYVVGEPVPAHHEYRAKLLESGKKA